MAQQYAEERGAKAFTIADRLPLPSWMSEAIAHTRNRSIPDEDLNVLRDLITRCEARAAAAASGPIPDAGEWTGMLETVHKDLTAVVANDGAPAGLPAAKVWAVFAAEFPGITLTPDFESYFHERWFAFFCLHFGSATSATGGRLQVIMRMLVEQSTKLDSIASGVQEPLGRRTVPTRPVVGVGNVNAEVFGIEDAAAGLLALLRKPGPGIVTISAKPGFGKSTLLTRTLRDVLNKDGTIADSGPVGIFVLGAPDRLAIPLELFVLEAMRSRLPLAGTASPSASDSPEVLVSALLNYLEAAGCVWLVIENTENLLLDGGEPLWRMASAWCKRNHGGKLVLLSRVEPERVHPCQESASHGLGYLKTGLPLPEAVALLRFRLRGSRHEGTSVAILEALAESVGRVPQGLVSAARYLLQPRVTVMLTTEYIASQDWLSAADRHEPEQALRAITERHFAALPTEMQRAIQIVAIAQGALPEETVRRFVTGESIIDISQCTLLESTDANLDIPSWTMHGRVAEIVAARVPELTDTERGLLFAEGNRFGELREYRPAYSIFGSLESVIGKLVEHGRAELANDLAAVLMNKANALQCLRRFAEAISVTNDAIAIIQNLVYNEGRAELESALATAFVNKGVALDGLARFAEGITAHDDAIAILSDLIHNKGRAELANALASALMNRGAALDSLTRSAEAITSYDAAIAFLRDQTQDNGRAELAKIFMNKAVALHGLTRFAEAIATYDEAIVVLNQLVRDQGHAELASGLASALINRASTLVRHRR